MEVEGLWSWQWGVEQPWNSLIEWCVANNVLQIFGVLPKFWSMFDWGKGINGSTIFLGRQWKIQRKIKNKK